MTHEAHRPSKSPRLSRAALASSAIASVVAAAVAGSVAAWHAMHQVPQNVSVNEAAIQPPAIAVVPEAAILAVPPQEPPPTDGLDGSRSPTAEPPPEADIVVEPLALEPAAASEPNDTFEPSNAAVPDTPLPVVTGPVEPDLLLLRTALKAVRCAILDVSFEDGRVLVAGTVVGPGRKTRIKAIIQDQAPGLPLDDAVRVAAPALCEPLSLIEPFLVANAAATTPLAIRLDNRPGVPFRGGQSLSFDVAAPDFPAHLQVDYYTADGNVVHLLPNPLETSGRVEPRTVRRLGDRNAGGRFWTIGPPFGDELIVVVASAGPLFPTPRPEAEAASAYLPELKRVLEAAGTPAVADARFIATVAP